MEKDFSNKVMNRLQKYFFIQEEIWSKCGNYRIDYVLNDRKNDDVFFGVEFKDNDHKRWENIGEHILQSLRYSLSLFEVQTGVFKKIPILICPPISYNYLMCPVEESQVELQSKLHNRTVPHYHDRHERHSDHHTVNGLLGVFNLGEIRTTFQQEKQRIRFCFSNKIVWSDMAKYIDGVGYSFDTIKGLDNKNYNFLMKKIETFKIV